MGLYHSARGSVDYTIVGSPTISDGVVSGFSGSDFLRSSSKPLFCPNEGKIAFHYTRQSAMNQILMVCISGSYFPFRIRLLDRTIQLIWMTDSTTQATVLSGTYNITEGDYYITFNFSNSVWTVKLYNSSNELLETLTSDQTNVYWPSNASYIIIGAYSSTSYWQGSIDLNETYIKVNGQPWFGICPIEVKHINYGTSVGYTKIGNPTIENNVITYASGSNYLNFTSDFPSFANNDIDMVVKSTGIIQYLRFRKNGSDALILQETSGGALAFYSGGSPVLLLYNASNYSYIRFHKEANGKLTLLAGNDGVNWAIQTSKDDIVYEAFDSYRFISYVSSGGAVYLDETYIKLNGKLWFYRPSTNYLVKDNKLIWADSGIYVQEPSSGSALDSNTVALYHFDDNLNEEVTNTASELISGTPAYDTGEFDKSIAASLRIGQKGYVSDATSFTIDFWLYATSSVAGVILQDESNFAYGISYLGGGDYYTVGAWVAGATQITLPFPSGFTLLNTWHHIAYVYDKSAGKEYGFIDGAKVYEGSRSTHGKQLSLSRISSNCRIDEFRLSNVARWTSDFTVPTEPYGDLVPGAKNYATPNMAPVPAGYTYGTTTTTAIGYVDIPTQVFTAAPEGSNIGRDE